MTQVLDGLSQYVATDSGIYAPGDDLPVLLVDLESKFDRLWIGTVTTSDPLAPVGIGMRGIARAPSLPGMLLTAQGFDTTQITAELYRLSAPTTLVTALTDTRNRSWQETLSDPGSAAVTFQEDDTDLASIVGDGDDLILMKYAGVAALMMICESAEQTYISENEEADEVTVWSGRGHLALLERSQVYPTGGVGRRPIEDDRVFNWTSLDFDDSGWATAKIIDTVGGAQASWNVGIGPFWAADFPDASASVLWASTGTASFAPTGYSYFRQEVTIVTAGLHTIYALADNQMELYVDGQRLLAVDGFTMVNFTETSRVSLELSAGTHVISVRGYNSEPVAGFPNNPAGIAWTLYSTDPATSDAIALVAHSDGTSKIVEYPDEPPGMTPGQVMRLVLDEAQARGELLYISLGFSDTVDSDGAAWPTTSEIATKVGTDYLTFFREMSGTYIDLWMPPGSLELQAYNLFGRGSVKAISLQAPTDVTDPSTGNITTYRKKRDASPINRFLARWPGGWAERESAASITSYAARGATLGLGALDSLAEVYRVADAQLDIYNAPREEITIGIHPMADADRPYMTFQVGDTLTIPDGAGSTTTERVIAITVGEDGFTGLALLTVQLGNLLLPEDARLFQALKKMVNGTIQGDSKVAQPVALSGLFELRRIPGANTPSGAPTVIEPVLLAADFEADGGLTDVTDSVTISANQLGLFAVTQTRDDSGSPAVPVSVVDSGGRTWTQVATVFYKTSGVRRSRLTVYRSLQAAASTGTITITWDDTDTRGAWAIFQIKNVDTGGVNGADAVVQSATALGLTFTPSATLAAFADTRNGTIGICASNPFSGTTIPSFTAGSGFTEIADVGTTATPPLTIAVEYRTDNSTTVDGSLNGSSPPDWGMIGLEIKLAQ